MRAVCIKKGGDHAVDGLPSQQATAKQSLASSFPISFFVSFLVSALLGSALGRVISIFSSVPSRCALSLCSSTTRQDRSAPANPSLLFATHKFRARSPGTFKRTRPSLATLDRAASRALVSGKIPTPTSPSSAILPFHAKHFPLRTARCSSRPRLSLVTPSATTTTTCTANMGAPPALGALGLTFTAMRGMQAIALITIIGLTSNFISEMVAASYEAPSALVGTLVVVSQGDLFEPQGGWTPGTRG